MAREKGTRIQRRNAQHDGTDQKQIESVNTPRAIPNSGTTSLRQVICRHCNTQLILTDQPYPRSHGLPLSLHITPNRRRVQFLQQVVGGGDSRQTAHAYFISLAKSIRESFPRNEIHSAAKALREIPSVPREPGRRSVLVHR